MKKICSVVAIMVGSALLSLMIVAPSKGQHCSTSRPVVVSGPTYVGHYNPVYTPVKQVVVKEVVTPIAVPVIVPAFNFQYVPPACCAPAVAAPAVVPGMTPQPMGQQPVAQPAVTGHTPPVGGSPVVSKGGDDSIKQLAKALLEEIRRQESQGPSGADDGPPVAQGDAGFAQPPAATPQQPAPPGVHPGILAMNNACARCHTGNRAKGGVRIFDNPGVLNPLAPKDKILDSVSQGRMPEQGSPEHSKFTQADSEAIRNWALGR